MPLMDRTWRKALNDAGTPIDDRDRTHISVPGTSDSRFAGIAEELDDLEARVGRALPAIR